MGLIQWKQLDRNFEDGAQYTGSFNVSGSVNVESGSFFLENQDIREVIINGGLFRPTGSFWATTNDLQITGSLALKLDAATDEISVSVGSTERITINTEGVLILREFSTTPTAVEGGLFFSSSKELFLGV